MQQFKCQSQKKENATQQMSIFLSVANGEVSFHLQVFLFSQMELPTFATAEQVSRFTFNLEDLSVNELNETMKFFKLVGTNTTYNSLFQKQIIYKKEGVNYHSIWRHTLDMMNVSTKYPSVMVIFANYLLVHHRDIIHEQSKTIEERIEAEVQKRMTQLNGLPELRELE